MRDLRECPYAGSCLAVAAFSWPESHTYEASLCGPRAQRPKVLGQAMAFGFGAWVGVMVAAMLTASCPVHRGGGEDGTPRPAEVRR